MALLFRFCPVIGKEKRKTRSAADQTDYWAEE